MAAGVRNGFRFAQPKLSILQVATAMRLAQRGFGVVCGLGRSQTGIDELRTLGWVIKKSLDVGRPIMGHFELTRAMRRAHSK